VRWTTPVAGALRTRLRQDRHRTVTASSLFCVRLRRPRVTQPSRRLTGNFPPGHLPSKNILDICVTDRCSRTFLPSASVCAVFCFNSKLFTDVFVCQCCCYRKTLTVNQRADSDRPLVDNSRPLCLKFVKFFSRHLCYACFFDVRAGDSTNERSLYFDFASVEFAFCV